MKLFFSRNPNPRLAVAVARQVGANVEFEWVQILCGGENLIDSARLVSEPLFEGGASG
jgi:hypothetical protein